MDIVLNLEAEDVVILDALHECGSEDAVCCQDVGTFERSKKLLIKEKLKNVTVQLLDEGGYAIRQVTSKPKNKALSSGLLNSRQITVIKALEKVLKHCKNEGIQLIGYSDELVALPASVSDEEISSAGALDINCHDVYKGADAILPDEDV
ncbi:MULTISPECIES: response regulator [unclassified Neptuniibacter]|jgi:hypothetical protein|uniref:response regulator n=1 Tax=unclassified Neptuniibacter TaxID=2630693 RepID=UPI0026E368D4|nr:MULTISPECIES: response regulator [unclassified Neptuniibacter]MDO6514382.1 response regulator [Neptuniibacter sp. 2_MG-2023]MDO6594427.1 response regulator [Neptuniibacter sp. 1_MG-2023]